MVTTTTRPQVRDHRHESHDAPGGVVVRDHRTGSGSTIVRPPPVVVHHHHHHHDYEVAPPRGRPVAQDPGRAANAEFDNIFSRGDLSLEDKIMMLLFSVMAKMDKEISDKGKKVSKAKSDAPGSTSGTPQAGGDSAANGTSALDVQTQELQQLVTRRNQMFAMLTAIVSKFDESTEKVLRALGQ